MKIAMIVARVLLGLLFAFAGFTKIFPLFPMQFPAGDAGVVGRLMVAHKWMMFHGCVELAGGLMLLIGRFVPLGLTLLAGMITNILLFNITLYRPTVPVALAVGLVEAFLVYAYRASFAGIFEAKAKPAV